jgi:hypothetical protein
MSKRYTPADAQFWLNCIYCLGLWRMIVGIFGGNL